MTAGDKLTMTFNEMKKEEIRLQIVLANMVIHNRADEDLVISKLNEIEAEMVVLLDAKLVALLDKDNERAFKAGEIK